MSVWAEFNGIVSVLIDNHISLEKVFNEVFKGADKGFKIIDKNVTEAFYQYTIKGVVDLEAQLFFPKWKEFVEKAKLYQADVDLSLRWVK